jgi:uncharacterized protein
LLRRRAENRDFLRAFDIEMKKRIICFIVLLLAGLGAFVAIARADDYEDAVEAYLRGDRAAAAGLFLKEAQAGNVRAMYKLGYIYFSEGSMRDYPAAAKWYRMAAEKGYEPAMFNLADMYTDGIGVSQDDKEAFKWYRAAAEKGHTPAMYNLAVAYAEGRGVGSDRKESFRWFLKAAEKGLVQAQYTVGLIYADGIGTLQNEKEAFKWFSLAAGQGHKTAKCCLAEIYATGMGAPKDKEKARQLAREGLDAGEELCRFVLEKHKLQQK